MARSRLASAVCALRDSVQRPQADVPETPAAPAAASQSRSARAKCNLGQLFYLLRLRRAPRTLAYANRCAYRHIPAAAATSPVIRSSTAMSSLSVVCRASRLRCGS